MDFNTQIRHALDGDGSNPASAAGNQVYLNLLREMSATRDGDSAGNRIFVVGGRGFISREFCCSAHMYNIQTLALGMMAS